MRRLLALVLVLAACSSAAREEAPAAVPIDRQVVAVDGIAAIAQSLEGELQDLDIGVPEVEVPEQLVVVWREGRTYLVTVDDRRAFALPPEQDEAFLEPDRYGASCRPELVRRIDGRLVIVAADGADRADLAAVADGVRIDDGLLDVAPGIGTVTGSLPRGWATNPAASSSIRRGDLDAQVVIPLKVAQRSSLDELLCRQLTELRTGISNMDRYDLTPFERHGDEVDGREVTVGALDKRTAVVTVGGVPSFAVLSSVTASTPGSAAAAAAGAQLVPREPLDARREALVQEQAAPVAERFRELLAEAGLRVLAEGRDDDTVWILNDDGSGGVCMQLVRGYTGWVPERPELNPFCLGRDALRGPIATPEYSAGQFAAFGLAAADVPAVVAGGRRVPTVPIDSPAAPRAFVARGTSAPTLPVEPVTEG